MQYGPASGMPPGMSQYAYMPQYAASQYPAAYMPQAAYYAAAMPGNQYGGYAPPQGYAPNQPATSYAGGSGFGNHSYGKQQHSSYNHGEAAARLHNGAFAHCMALNVPASTACISCLHGSHGCLQPQPVACAAGAGPIAHERLSALLDRQNQHELHSKGAAPLPGFAHDKSNLFHAAGYGAGNGYDEAGYGQDSMYGAQNASQMQQLPRDPYNASEGAASGCSMQQALQQQCSE